MNKERLVYMDQMKGVAIFLMVVGHVLLFTFGIDYDSPLMEVTVSDMPIFFFVSGFFCYKTIATKETYLECLKKKCVRLLPPWIVFSIITAYVGQKSFVGTVCEFYWFFYVLFTLSVLMITLEYLLFRHCKKDIVYVCMLFLPTVIFAVLHIMGCSMENLPFFYLSMYGLSFNLGWLCRKYEKLNCFLRENQLVSLVSFIIFSAYIFNLFPANNYISCFAGICGIIFIQSCLYKLSSEGANKSLSILGRVGKSTLAIYVLNFFLLPDFQQGGVIINTLDSVSLFLLSVCVAAIVVVCCMIVEAVFHSNKYLKKIL